ncbi:MAG TPA: hypothetical protein EYG85_02710 [Crocinitomix sp.]|nr:hypothetical protein [Crocinitomix sp.]
MNKLFSLIFVVLLTINAYSKTYSYSFEGVIELNEITNFEKECAKIKFIKKVKIKYKPDSQKGEIIIITEDFPKGQRQEGKDSFQPTEVKKFILSKGLTPLNFREIKN